MAAIPGGTDAPGGDGPVTRSVIPGLNISVAGTAISGGTNTTAQYKRCEQGNQCHTCEIFSNECEWKPNEGLEIGCPITTCPYHTDKVKFPIVRGTALANVKAQGGSTWCKGPVFDRRKIETTR